MDQDLGLLMQLIDVLEERSDSLKIVESVDKAAVNFNEVEGQWYIVLDDAAYALREDALDTMLNLLRIPIKYIKRCTERNEEDYDTGGIMLAESSVNYWLEKYGSLSYLVMSDADIPTVTQVFPGKRLYIPGVKINDLILDYLMGKGHEVNVESFIIKDDVFEAIYVTDKIQEINGLSYNVGVRVLFSDCFTITPRFDGVLVGSGGEVIPFPVVKRKFRVAGSNIPLVFDQIEEFLDLSLEGLENTLIPALDALTETPDIDPDKFVKALAAELRVSAKIKNEMRGWLGDQACSLLDIVEKFGHATSHLGEDSNIDVELARTIQVSITNYTVGGTFK
jgi:hypothetical protein